MSRAIPTSIVSALSQEEITPFYAVELLFDTSPLRFWTGLGDRTVDGSVYSGAGSLLSISGLEEIGDLSAKSVTISLSGLNAAIVSLALQEPYQRRKCRILFGVVGSTDFVEVFSGQMNTMTVNDDGQSATVELLVDSKLVELERARVFRYTSESLKSEYSDDTFFDYVSGLQDVQITWGRPMTNNGIPAGKNVIIF